jgi:DNA-directed RNA polymerase
MRKSLQCLYSDDPSQLATFPLHAIESPDTVENDYEMEMQRQLEEGAYSSAVEVWKHEMDEARKRGDIYASRLGIRSLAWDWVQAMKPVLEEKIERMRPKNLNASGKETVPSVERDTETQKMDWMWLAALPVEKLCAITIMEIIRLHISDGRANGCKAGVLITAVGRAVESEIQATDLVNKENRGLLPKSLNLRQLFNKKTRAEQYAASFHRKIVKGMKNGVTSWPFEWRQDVRARVPPSLNRTYSGWSYPRLCITRNLHDPDEHDRRQRRSAHASRTRILPHLRIRKRQKDRDGET